MKTREEIEKKVNDHCKSHGSVGSLQEQLQMDTIAVLLDIRDLLSKE